MHALGPLGSHLGPWVYGALFQRNTLYFQVNLGLTPKVTFELLCRCLKIFQDFGADGTSGGIARPLRMLSKGETLRKRGGGIAPNWPC